MAEKWKEAIELDNSQSIALNVTPWVSRAALDAIGEGEWWGYDHIILLNLLTAFAAAFDYQFGALDSLDHPLAKVYTNVM